VSRLQKIVALSMMEAEYVTVTEACKELIYPYDFLKELGKEREALSLCTVTVRARLALQII